jgi:hypothetical protein
VRRIAALAAFAALLLVPGTQAGRPAPVLATLSSGVTADLVRLDPATLRIEGPRLPLWRHALPWTRLPDGSRLAIGGARSIRLVDVRAWRRLRDVRFRGALVALAWPEPRRLLTILAGRCCPQRLRAVVFDPETGKPTVQRSLGRGSAYGAVGTPSGLVLLLAPPVGIGAPRVVTLDAAARGRTIAVRGVEAGWARVRRASPSGPSEQRYRTPGLAVDEDGARALVVGAGGFVLVDLRTGEGEWRPLHARTLAAGGFGSGSYRRAAWIAPDLVAVAGWDDRVLGEGTKRRQESRPAGLTLIDVRTLTVRTVEPRATFFSRAGGLLLVPEGSRGGGLSAYRLDGRRRFRVPRVRAVGDLSSAGRFTYVGLSEQYRTHPVRVIDLSSGRVVRTVSVPGMLTLLTPATRRVCQC